MCVRVCVRSIGSVNWSVGHAVSQSVSQSAAQCLHKSIYLRLFYNLIVFVCFEYPVVQKPHGVCWALENSYYKMNLFTLLTLVMSATNSVGISQQLKAQST